MTVGIHTLLVLNALLFYFYLCLRIQLSLITPHHLQANSI